MKYVRDSRSIVIGGMQDEGSLVRFFNKQMNAVGWYSKSENYTYFRGRRFGPGNQGYAVIHEANR